MSNSNTKKSRGVTLKRIENEKQRQVCFTKRRSGLINKALESSIICDAQIAVLVSSPCHKAKRKVYAFGHPSVDAIIDAFLLYGNGINGNNNAPPFPVDYGVKQRALFLFDDIKKLQLELDSIMKKSKSVENLNEEEIFSILDGYEKSGSIDELEDVVDALEKLFVRAKARVGSDSISCVPSNENPKSSSNNNSTSKNTILNDDQSMFKDPNFATYYNTCGSVSLVGYEGNNVMLQPKPASCFNNDHNDKGKGKMVDCFPDLSHYYNDYVNGYGAFGGSTCMSGQFENFDFANWSTSDFGNDYVNGYSAFGGSTSMPGQFGNSDFANLSTSNFGDSVNGYGAFGGSTNMPGQFGNLDFANGSTNFGFPDF